MQDNGKTFVVIGFKFFEMEDKIIFTLFTYCKHKLVMKLSLNCKKVFCAQKNTMHGRMCDIVTEFKEEKFSGFNSVFC